MTQCPAAAVGGLIRVASSGGMTAEELAAAATSVIPAEEPSGKETLKRMTSFELSLHSEEERIDALISELERFQALVDAPDDHTPPSRSPPETPNDLGALFPGPSQGPSQSSVEQSVGPTTVSSSNAGTPVCPKSPASHPASHPKCSPGRGAKGGSGKHREPKGLSFSCTGWRFGKGGAETTPAKTVEIVGKEMRIYAPNVPAPKSADAKRRRRQQDPFSGALLDVIELGTLSHGWEEGEALMLQLRDGSCRWIAVEALQWGSPIVKALRAHEVVRPLSVAWTARMPAWASTKQGPMPKFPPGPRTWPLWGRAALLSAFCWKQKAQGDALLLHAILSWVPSETKPLPGHLEAALQLDLRERQTAARAQAKMVAKKPSKNKHADTGEFDVWGPERFVEKPHAAETIDIDAI
eukprot:Hpha_TRINITY_DN16635_c1_g3::TRINITY_DN16635_c1_g3_i1::g.180137::m.180137